MAKGISIGVAADTGPFSSAVKSGILEPLTDVQDALEQTAKAGDDAGASLEKSMKGAQTATETSARTIEETNQSIVQSNKRTYTQDKENFELSEGEKNRIQKESVKAGASAVAQTVAQSASALQDIGTDAAGTVGNIAATVAGVSMNPIVAAVGAGVATVAGFVGGLISKANSDTEELDKSVQDLTDDFIKSGTSGKASLGYIVDQMKKIADGTDEAGLSLEDIKKRAKELGVPFKDLAAAHAGSTAAVDKNIAAAKRQAASAEATIRATAQEGGFAAEQAHDEAVRKFKDAETELANLEALKAKLKDAAKNEKDAAAAGLPAWERKLNLMNQVDDAYTDAASDVDDYINKETGLFDVKAYIKAMEARSKALDDYKNDLNNSKLSASAKDFLESQGEEASATMLQGYKKSSPAQQAELNRIWSISGQTSSDNYSGSFTKGIAGNPPKVKPKLVQPTKADINAWTNDFRRGVSSIKPIKVPVVLVTRNGQQVP